MNRRQQSKRRERPNLIGPIHFSTDLLLTRLADHFYVRNLDVAMLSVALLHTAVLRSLFRVSHFPRTSVISRWDRRRDCRGPAGGAGPIRPDRD